ncbi:KdsC family phosphatase [Anaerobaca lacustris]|uniref:HAD hydrolase family protein n=1 Tax=Anaerobaca lacustris TaxID=3044600 RepID=A0AAW6U0X2_9BACT|nr:HAD hydrolase family protein [Sedimentisphaerales bacterium M17dextr]
MTNLDAIELLVLDVDGVLSDGQLVLHGDGSESKCFHTHDGHGIRMWQRAGGKTALLSGRYSEPTQRRADQLEIAHVIQDCHFKLPALQKLLDALHLKPENVAYIGDDLPDLPPIRFVALGIAPANAVDEVKQEADYVTTRPGGQGAVREAIEYILKNSGRWQALMERYLA